jgi:hypothetical protein
LTLTVAGALLPAILPATTEYVAGPSEKEVAVHVAVSTIVDPTFGVDSLAESVHTGTAAVTALVATEPGAASSARAGVT